MHERLKSACGLPALLGVPAIGVLPWLAACSPSEDTQHTRAPEPWSNEAEAGFQEAEALRYSLRQHELEQRRLRDAGLEGSAPVPGYPQTEQQ